MRLKTRRNLASVANKSSANDAFGAAVKAAEIALEGVREEAKWVRARRSMYSTPNRNS